MRMRKKKNLPARMERCAQLLIGAPEAQKGRWRVLMPGAQQLWVELGCGKGRFTCRMAQMHPDVLFVAVERVPDAMIVAMERAAELALSNVFFVAGDAALVQEYFAPEEVSMLFINFCDPWPPKRQAKRRLTHAGFLARYRAVLTSGGHICFKTDNRDLFEFSLLEMEAAGYALSEVTRDLHAQGAVGVMTDYEEKFHQQGMPICRCVARKK